MGIGRVNLAAKTVDFYTLGPSTPVSFTLLLPGRLRGREPFGDAHPARRGRDAGERVIAIVEQIARCRVVRKRFAESLGRPRRGRTVMPTCTMRRR
jgi:hypothetical protein